MWGSLKKKGSTGDAGGIVDASRPLHTFVLQTIISSAFEKAQYNINMRNDAPN